MSLSRERLVWSCGIYADLQLAGLLLGNCNAAYPLCSLFHLSEYLRPLQVLQQLFPADTSGVTVGPTLSRTVPEKLPWFSVKTFENLSIMVLHTSAELQMSDCRYQFVIHFYESHPFWSPVSLRWCQVLVHSTNSMSYFFCVVGFLKWRRNLPLGAMVLPLYIFRFEGVSLSILLRMYFSVITFTEAPLSTWNLTFSLMSVISNVTKNAIFLSVLQGGLPRSSSCFHAEQWCCPSTCTDLQSDFFSHLLH